MSTLLERFKRYIAVETRANETSEQTPSSEGQFTLANLLADEMRALGLQDVTVDAHAYATGILKGNRPNAPRIALIAHLDTAPDLSGLNPEPRIFVYEGGDITLPSGAAIRVQDFPELLEMKGETLITTDGDTLLGCDNKGGIAIIMTVVDQLIKEGSPHGDIAVVFTPDEEIGHGAALLDLATLNAAFGFTIDGGEVGEFETETFNAAKVDIHIQGRITHPGSAKGVMVNANLLVAEFLMMLPAGERPELTEKREGFIMVDKVNSEIEEASIQLIIRDHDRDLFAKKKQVIVDAVAFLNKKYGERVTVSIADQYLNMAEILNDHPDIADLAMNAMREVGIEPKHVPVRGGTDGAQLTYRGLPCPNIFTGGYNFHSKTEFASLDQMKKSVQVVQRIVENAAK